MGFSDAAYRDSVSSGLQSDSVWQRRPCRYHPIACRLVAVAGEHQLRVRRSCRGWLRSEPVDAAQDVGEQVAGNGDLGHLERDVAPVADDLRVDLDELVAQRRQRPLLDDIGQRERPHEATKVVGQGMKLEPDLVVAELLARQARPANRVLAFLDVLPGGTALIVERDHALGGSGSGW